MLAKQSPKSGLSDEALLWSLGAIDSPVITRSLIENNITACQGGFFGSSNDWMEDEARKLHAADQVHFHRTKSARAAVADTATNNRLVQGRKSPTAAQVGFRPHIVSMIERNRGSKMGYRQKQTTVIGENNDDQYSIKAAQHHTRAYLMRRDWSKQTKLQIINHPAPSDAPEINVGERYTESLTTRAVKKIFESGAYVAECQGGFTTFLTLTFTTEQRERLFGGEMTIGSEVSRFLDGAKKMYQRGWVAEVGNKDLITDTVMESVPAKESDFHYLWVAECPANVDGEPNPHVHLLLNWQVEPKHFQSWSQRLENLWGHGFAKLERIRHGQGAAKYLLKAVGYAAKGKNADQGLIKGNRYNIARCSRAPSWEVLASFEVDNMAAIIKECGYKLEQWKAPFMRQKSTLNWLKKKASEAKETKQYKKLNALKKKVEAAEQTALINREKINERGAHASSLNPFSITFEGESSTEKMDSFLVWAAGARGWSMVGTESTGDHKSGGQGLQPLQLEDIRIDAVNQYYQEHERFLLRRASWQAQLNQSRPETFTIEEIERIEADVMADYFSYQETVSQ
ncbi:hypothetical protein ST37_01785 (plasmid) [Vibrio sp. qd031]|nr:hypothetical protein ST37_01785 [Vibrio sp. qd031]